VLSQICELLQVASRLKRPTEAQMLVPQLQTNYDAAEAALRSLQAKYQQQG
jgi:hypothetical protein